MKLSIIIITLVSIFSFCITSCSEQKKTKKTIENEINSIVDDWHLRAANADSLFFNYLAPDAIYIGTDASERWTKDEFKTFAMPFFKRGKAWDFKPIKRNLYFTESPNIVYFDETLDSWMGVCRSSGVVVNINSEWKIKYYHLSMTIPNVNVKDILKLINTDSVKTSI